MYEFHESHAPIEVRFHFIWVQLATLRKIIHRLFKLIILCRKNPLKYLFIIQRCFF